jgi:hypothetical protein
MLPPNHMSSGVRSAFQPTEEFKGNDQYEQDHLFQREFDELKSDMREAGVQKTQSVMGQSVEMKKIHTREMSRIFRSKKEIYQILLIEGQYYLPPFEDCTIDFLRDMFSGRKRVSNHSVGVAWKLKRSTRV